MSIFSVLLAEVWPYIIGAAGLIAGLFFARQSGKSAGKIEAKLEQFEAEASAREEAQHVQNETAAMSDDDIDADLARWVRGNKR